MLNEVEGECILPGLEPSLCSSASVNYVSHEDCRKGKQG